MNKLKVDNNLKKDLDELLIGIKKGEKEEILNHHIKRDWVSFVELERLSLEELTIALFIGYELNE